MALIKCQNCGNDVDGTEEKCSNCGCTLQKEIISIANNQLKPKKSKKKIIACGTLVVAITVIVSSSVAVPKIQEQIRLSKNYNHAIELLDNNEYEDAEKAFAKLGDYKDSKEQYLKCFYNEGIDKNEESKYESAIECFEKAKGYKDSEEKIKESNYLLANEEYENEDYSMAAIYYEKADDYEDAKDKYDECIYKYGIDLADNYHYTDAAKQLSTIDYKDSQKLAKQYKKLVTERFFNNRFHYATREFASLLDENLSKFDDDYSAEFFNEDDECALIVLEYYNDISSTTILLDDINKEDNTFGEIVFLMDDAGDTNESLEVDAELCCICLVDLSLDIDDAREIATKLLDDIENKCTNKITKNGLTYESIYDFKSLAIKIYPSEKKSA